MTNRRIILGTIFLSALGYGLLIPVLPEVVRRFDADPSFVSRYLGYFIAIYAVHTKCRQPRQPGGLTAWQEDPYGNPWMDN